MERRSRLARLGLASLPVLAGLAVHSATCSAHAGDVPAIAAPAAAAPVVSAPAAVPTDPAADHKILPITLDTVLRIAEEQNYQIALARARVDESCAASDLAAKRWLPDIYAGSGYFRHEGGIQQEDGSVIHSSFGAQASGLAVAGNLNLREYAYAKIDAERKQYQQQGELKRITNEQLLDAANTYLDLLAAKTAEAIARDMEKHLSELLPKAESMAKDQPAAEVEVERIRAEMTGRRQTILHLQSQARSASYKLAYLLGLPPCTELVPVDKELIPIDMVDIGECVDALVAKAMANGPGIQEMESIVSLVENAVKQANGPGRFMPNVAFGLAEDAFGGGPGSRLDYDNRLDVGVAVYWNLTDLFTSGEKHRMMNAQRDQAHIAYQDLRARLTAGVQEARESIVTGKQEIKLGQDQINYAEQARQRSKLRIDKLVPGATPTEVMLSLQSLGMAQTNRLNAVRDYNKAQLRLMLLVGCQ